MRSFRELFAISGSHVVQPFTALWLFSGRKRGLTTSTAHKPPRTWTRP